MNYLAKRDCIDFIRNVIVITIFKILLVMILKGYTNIKLLRKFMKYIALSPIEIGWDSLRNGQENEIFTKENVMIMSGNTK